MTAAGEAPGPAMLARLRRQPKRALLVAALVPVLVILWIPLLTGGSKPASVPQPATTQPATEAASPPPSAPLAEMAPSTPAAIGRAGVTELSTRIDDLRRPYEPRWHPTDNAPAAPAAAIAPIRVEHDAPQLTPSSILVSPGTRPIAIVQGRPCGVGDAVLGHTIVDITERHVVYRHESRVLTVPLSPPSLGGHR